MNMLLLPAAGTTTRINILSEKKKKLASKRRKQQVRKSVDSPPAFSKIITINPFADWNMPKETGGYIKARERDCF